MGIFSKFLETWFNISREDHKHRPSSRETREESIWRGAEQNISLFPVDEMQAVEVEEVPPSQEKHFEESQEIKTGKEESKSLEGDTLHKTHMLSAKNEQIEMPALTAVETEDEPRPEESIRQEAEQNISLFPVDETQAVGVEKMPLSQEKCFEESQKEIKTEKEESESLEGDTLHKTHTLSAKREQIVMPALTAVETEDEQRPEQPIPEKELLTESSTETVDNPVETIESEYLPSVDLDDWLAIEEEQPSKTVILIKKESNAVLHQNENRRGDALEYLLRLGKQKGYLLTDDIFNVSEQHDLSITDTDWLSSEITAQGILVYSENPEQRVHNGKTNLKHTDALAEEDSILFGVDADWVEDSGDDGDSTDRAQSDYEAIYQRVLEIDPSLATLVEEVRGITPPQMGENKLLNISVKEGNLFARKRMIESHLRIAIRIALRISERFDLELADCISIAILGLITAVDKYDARKNGPFGSYSSFWIFQFIARERPAYQTIIYKPVHVIEKEQAVYEELKKSELLEETYLPGCPEAQKIVSDTLNVSADEAAGILKGYIRISSLDEFQEEDFPAIEEDGLERYCQEECRQAIDDMLSTLSKREEDVIRLRFGLDDGVERTLEEVGSIFHVTRERARQIEAKALKEMKHRSRSKYLRRLQDFWY